MKDSSFDYDRFDRPGRDQEPRRLAIDGKLVVMQEVLTSRIFRYLSPGKFPLKEIWVPNMVYGSRCVVDNRTTWSMRKSGLSSS